MQMYKFDTHVHTNEVSSCGLVPGSEMARLYKKAGYCGIIITDHFHSGFFDQFSDLPWHEKVAHFLVGYRAAHDEGQEIGLTVLLGMEIRFPERYNDYLVYGFDEAFLMEYEDLHETGLERFRRLIQGSNIRIYQAHPFRDDMERVSPKLLDGVEVFNGNPRHDSRNPLAKSYAQEHSLKMLAGSDSHQVGDVGRSGILIPRPMQTIAEFVTLLDSGDGYELILGQPL